MKKLLDFPPYTEAEIREIREDGSILCNLTGPASLPEEAPFSDTGIIFPPDSPILGLTAQEREAFESEKGDRAAGA